MKKLTEMTLTERIDTMMTFVEQAEIDLSKRNTTWEDVESIATVLDDIFNSVKEEFLTGKTITTDDGTTHKTWDSKALDDALNQRHPGLSFRLDSVTNALEDLFDFLKI